jgi:LysR family transcriptional regulator for metE and metH
VQRDILGPAGVVPAHVSRLPLTEAILELVQAGLGISILTAWAAAPQIARGDLVSVALDSPGSRRRWSAARRLGGAHPPYEAAFVSLLESAFAASGPQQVPADLRLRARPGARE